MTRLVRRAGFTLIEILAAMAILALGMVSVFGLVYGSMKLGVNAADRNAAAAIIPQAIEDIQRTYLVTGNMQFVGSPMHPTTQQIDLMLLTVPSADPVVPSIQQAQFAPFRGAQVTQPLTNATNTATWPFGLDPVYYGGPVNAGASTDQTSYAYRVIFRLERHPQWLVDTDVFAGMYMLTLTVYRDPGRKAARLEQISDPVVVYLRDKKVRI